MLRLWQLLGCPSRSWQHCPDSDSVRKLSRHDRFAGSYTQGDCPHAVCPHSPPAWLNLHSHSANSSSNFSPPSLLSSPFSSPALHLSSLLFLLLASPSSPLPSLPSPSIRVLCYWTPLHSPEREVGLTDKPGCFLLKQQWLWNRNYPPPLKRNISYFFVAVSSCTWLRWKSSVHFQQWLTCVLREGGPCRGRKEEEEGRKG